MSLRLLNIMTTDMTATKHSGVLEQKGEMTENIQQ